MARNKGSRRRPKKAPKGRAKGWPIALDGVDELVPSLAWDLLERFPQWAGKRMRVVAVEALPGPEDALVAAGPALAFGLKASEAHFSIGFLEPDRPEPSWDGLLAFAGSIPEIEAFLAEAALRHAAVLTVFPEPEDGEDEAAGEPEVLAAYEAFFRLGIDRRGQVTGVATLEPRGETFVESLTSAAPPGAQPRPPMAPG